MSEISDRYRKIAGQFTERVEAVPAGAWDNPAPCEGWVARDVVRHLVEWIPGFFTTYAGVAVTGGPSADVDPVAAWRAVDASLEAALGDPALAAREFDAPPGRVSLEQAIDMFCTGDILIHTWDLARAAGLDETLDPVEVERALAGMQSIDEDMLRNSGHYGPRVDVPADADDQTKLIAFTGRHP
jgi:uncharacterized protein (TIGR03086 family)